MITIIKRATAADYLALFNNIIPGWVIYHGGERVGIGGLNYHPSDDRLWAYLNIKGELDHAGRMQVLREMRTGLKAIPQDVYVLCEEHAHKSAPRLLRVLGFEKTDEQTFGQDVWVHRATEGE